MPTYIAVADVSKVLRAAAEGSKVRTTADGVKQVATYNGNAPVSTVICAYQDFVLATDFAGQKTLKVNFTSATDFAVYEVERTLKQMLLLSTGDIATDYVTPDGVLTIPAGTIAGTIVSGYSINIELDVHISNDSIEEYIDDAEIEIDGMIAEGRAAALASGETRLYTDVTVPPQVSLSTQYLAAYYVYSDVNYTKFVNDDESGSSFANRWKKRAETVLLRYIKTARRSVPTVYSFPGFIDKFGVKNVGPEPAEITSVEDDILRDTEQEDIFDPGF